MFLYFLPSYHPPKALFGVPKENIRIKHGGHTDRGKNAQTLVSCHSMFAREFLRMRIKSFSEFLGSLNEALKLGRISNVSSNQSHVKDYTNFNSNLGRIGLK